MPGIKWLANNVGTIDGLLTESACDHYVRFSEGQRFEEAPISTDLGAVIEKDVRNNDRVILDDPGLAQEMYHLVESLLAPRFQKKWRPIGLNERLRFYRYDAGQYFDWHSDGYYERPGGERSFFTFMIYLNDDFEGGGTSFRDDRFHRLAPEALTVRPKKGMALLFHHPAVHRGDAVTTGRKYVLRTDLMYGPALRSVS